MENNKPPITILFNGKYILRDRVIAMYISEYKISPYIQFSKSFYSVKKFPYIKRTSFPMITWKTRHCVEVLMDNGKIFREWYYDTGHKGGYSSGVNAQCRLDALTRNFNYVYPPHGN